MGITKIETSDHSSTNATYLCTSRAWAGHCRNVLARVAIGLEAIFYSAQVQSSDVAEACTNKRPVYGELVCTNPVAMQKILLIIPFGFIACFVSTDLTQFAGAIMLAWRCTPDVWHLVPGSAEAGWMQLAHPSQ